MLYCITQTSKLLLTTRTFIARVMHVYNETSYAMYMCILFKLSCFFRTYKTTSLRHT